MEIVKAFQDNEVGININIKGTHIDPLFRASDIGTVLELSNINKNISDFTETERVSLKVITLGGEQEVTFLTELGLYKILFRSRKDIAVKFQDWVCKVIKEIRLNGVYDLQKQLKEKDIKIDSVLNQKEQNLLKNFSKKPIFYIGLVEDNIVKFGYTDDI